MRVAADCIVDESDGVVVDDLFLVAECVSDDFVG